MTRNSVLDLDLGSIKGLAVINNFYQSKLPKYFADLGLVRLRNDKKETTVLRKIWSKKLNVMPLGNIGTLDYPTPPPIKNSGFTTDHHQIQILVKM